MFRSFCCLIILFFFAVNTLFAQTPPYGLGDPAININFGSGTPVFGSEFPGYNNFIYIATVPDFGYYTRLNNTNVNTNWWATSDHTSGPGGTGYMLIAKPRNNVGFETLVQATATGLCAGTSYQASAFLLNLTKAPGGVQPELSFRVLNPTTGNPIVPDLDFVLPQLTQDPTREDWVNPILSFTLPAGVSSVRVQVICKSNGGPALNDFAVDDITVNATGQKIDAMFTSGDPDKKVTCAETVEQFAVSATPPDAGNKIKWQKKLNNGNWIDIPDSESENFTINSETTPGVWRYRAASAPPIKIESPSCSVVSNEIEILVRPILNRSAGPDKFYLINGAPVMLEGSSNSTDVSWEVVDGDDISSLSSTTVARPLASPAVTTTYRLIAKIDANTCGPAQVVDEVKVIVAEKVDPTNTFTPNGDGFNDKWIIGGIESYPNPVVQVYNRNGQLVYRSAGVISPWDGTYNGKNVPAGTYYYIIDLGLNGLKYSGSVTVLR